jgi:hypothetical protein
VATSLEDASQTPVDRATLAGYLVRELRILLAPPLALDGDVAREIEARDVLKGRAVTAPGEVRRVMAGGVRIREG